MLPNHLKFREEMEVFIGHHAPLCHSGVRWGMSDQSIEFSMDWSGFGWSQGMGMNFYPDEGCQLRWGSTTRGLANAVAFIAAATELTNFAARLQVYAEQLMKDLKLTPNPKK